MTTSANSGKMTILFLCTGNSCRSQMAEGWAKATKTSQIQAYSAGIEKHGVDPLAIKAMAEAGIDISAQRSTGIDDMPVQEFDWIITLCGHAEETCPHFPGNKFHQGFDDPPRLAAAAESDEEKLVHYRRVRDEIRDFVLSLPDALQRTDSGRKE